MGLTGFEPIFSVPQTDVLPIKLQTHKNSREWDLNPRFYGHNVMFYQLNYPWVIIYTMTMGLEPISLNLEFNILPIKLRHLKK